MSEYVPEPGKAPEKRGKTLVNISPEMDLIIDRIYGTIPLILRGVSMTDSKIETIISPMPTVPKATRVAAYARVSTGKDAQLESLATQVSYYNRIIQERPGWVFAGVYADEAISGTRNNRESFERLVADCRAGLVDLVVTKSISRFARNTVTLLETVRELKSLGIDVFFEEQNIHTLSGEGELMLTILAGFAEEESLSASENAKWRVRKNYEEGKLWSYHAFGYRQVDSRLVVVPDEAEIIKRIFREYLGGSGSKTISAGLNRDGATVRSGRPFSQKTVLRILHNYTYTGNLLLQTTFSENHLTKRKKVNNGQLPKYHIENAHEPIVSLSDYLAAQDEMRRRAKANGYKENRVPATYPFTGIIVCAGCGKHYRRKSMRHSTVWICPTFNQKGKACCPSKQIPEETLMRVTVELFGDCALLREKVTMIKAESGNLLTFCLKDGKEITRRWEDRSRAESWTPEMREAAAKRTKERRNAKATDNSNSGNSGHKDQKASEHGKETASGRIRESLD